MSNGKSEEEFNIALAKLVEKYPCLYDFTRKDYNNTTIRSTAWQEISQQLSSESAAVTVEDCKLRWKSLRGCITRDKKFARQGNKNKKPYYLQEHLEFVKPFTRAASRTSRASVRLVSYPSDLEEPLSNDPDSREGSAENQPVHVTIKQECLQQLQQLQQAASRPEPPAKKPRGESRDLEAHPLAVDEDVNPDLIFFRSLIPDMNRMNPRQRSSFRLGVVSLLDQVLYGNAENHFTEHQQAPNSTVVNWSH